MATQPTNPPSVSAWPASPSRAEPATFSAKSDAFLGHFPIGQADQQNLVNWLNSTAGQAYQNALESASSATSSATSAQLSQDALDSAISATNYKGAWSSLSGALNIPASVSHSDGIWLLTTNLANVAASEPAIGNSNWLLVYSRATDLQMETGAAYTNPDSKQIKDFIQRDWHELTTAKSYNESCFYRGKEYDINNPVDDVTIAPPTTAGRTYTAFDGVDDYVAIPTITLQSGDVVKFKFRAPTGVVGIISTLIDSDTTSDRSYCVLNTNGTWFLAGNYQFKVDGQIVSSGVSKYPTDGLTHDVEMEYFGAGIVDSIAASSPNRGAVGDFYKGQIYDLEVIRNGTRIHYFPLRVDAVDYGLNCIVKDPEMTSEINWQLGAGWSLSNNALTAIGGVQSSVTTQLRDRYLTKVTIIANITVSSGSLTIGGKVFNSSGMIYHVIDQANDTLTITKSSDFVGSVNYVGAKNSEIAEFTNLFGSLSGAAKFAGIVKADNGLLYCAPRDSAQILEIDPVNKATNLFGNIIGTAKFYGITKADNGLLYCAPRDSTQVLEIDPVNKTTNLFGSVSGTNKWRGIAKADNGLLYCAPYDSTQVLEIDPVNKTTNLFGNISGTAKFVGIVKGDNGLLYCAPFDSTQVLEIDPVNKTTNLFGSLSGSAKFAGIAKADNGLLYCAPLGSTQVLEIDPVNKATNLFGNIIGTAKFAGIAKADNGSLYCAPFDSAQVLEINPVNKTTNLFGSVSGTTKFIGIAKGDNGSLYCAPYDSTQVLEIGSADGTEVGSPLKSFEKHWKLKSGEQYLTKNAGVLRFGSSAVIDANNTLEIEPLANGSKGDYIKVTRTNNAEPTIKLSAADIAAGRLIKFGVQTDTELTIDSDKAVILEHNGKDIEVKI